MTKTDFKASVSSATTAAPSAPAETEKHVEETIDKSQLVSRDSYSATGDNSFKALMGGVKAATYGGGYAVLLKEMLAGLDETTASSDDFEEVEIPAASELLSVPGIAQDVDATEAIVERYEGLEDLLEGLLSQTDTQLANGDIAAQMSTEEILALKEYREELENKMLYCHKQLEVARFNHEWAKKDAEAAKEATLEETEWWNQD